VDALLEATARAEARHFWFVGFRKFVQPFLEQASAGGSGLRLLDCGCGTGSNLGMLGRYGLAYGFDLSARGLAFATQAGFTRVARAAVDAIPFPDAAFDIVTSFDVIYALPEQTERDALAEMRRVLRPGGALLINVAAMPMLRGSHSQLSKEVRRYTRGRLRAAVEGAGFRVVRLTNTNASLFPLMLAVRTVQRLKDRPAVRAAELELTTPPAPMNALLAGVLKIEARALRLVNLPFGSSLLCLARKPEEISARADRGRAESTGR
jgi:SAM-dependent methyltransferase